MKLPALLIVSLLLLAPVQPGAELATRNFNLVLRDGSVATAELSRGSRSGEFTIRVLTPDPIPGHPGYLPYPISRAAAANELAARSFFLTEEGGEIVLKLDVAASAVKGTRVMEAVNELISQKFLGGGLSTVVEANLVEVNAAKLGVQYLGPHQYKLTSIFPSGRGLINPERHLADVMFSSDTTSVIARNTSGVATRLINPLETRDVGFVSLDSIKRSALKLNAGAPTVGSVGGYSNLATTMLTLGIEKVQSLQDEIIQGRQSRKFAAASQIADNSRYYADLLAANPNWQQIPPHLLRARVEAPDSREAYNVGFLDIAGRFFNNFRNSHIVRWHLGCSD